MTKQNQKLLKEKFAKAIHQIKTMGMGKLTKEQQKLRGVATNKIINLLAKNFKLTKNEATEAFNEWEDSFWSDINPSRIESPFYLIKNSPIDPYKYLGKYYSSLEEVQKDKNSCWEFMFDVEKSMIMRYFADNYLEAEEEIEDMERLFEEYKDKRFMLYGKFKYILFHYEKLNQIKKSKNIWNELSDKEKKYLEVVYKKYETFQNN